MLYDVLSIATCGVLTDLEDGVQEALISTYGYLSFSVALSTKTLSGTSGIYRSHGMTSKLTDSFGLISGVDRVFNITSGVS